VHNFSQYCAQIVKLCFGGTVSYEQDKTLKCKQKVYFENNFLNNNEPICIEPMSFWRILLKLLQGQWNNTLSIHYFT